MRHRTGFALALLLVLSPAVLSAAAPEPCSCEYCLANLDAKCRPPGGGIASCAALVRSGACLGPSPASSPVPEAEVEPPVRAEAQPAAQTLCSAQEPAAAAAEPVQPPAPR